MILVGQYDSPFVRRVAVTLHHYHMPFTRNPLSVFRNAADMQKINPLIRVPALILEDGEVLVDSSAIIDYLDERAGPARAMTPPHGPERRKILQAAARATGAMDKGVHYYYELNFHDEKARSKEFLKRAVSQIAATLNELEHQCGAPWFFDNHMSQADVSITCLVAFLKMRMPEMFPADKYPRLHHLAQHCELRDEFIESRASAEEIGAPPTVKAKH